MKIPDECLLEYFRLTTDIPVSEAEKIIKEDVVEAHRVFAREIITMYHGKEFIKDAEERYNSVAKGEVPDDIDEINLSNENKEMPICDLLVKIKFATSKSEAKRMIQGKGVKLNNDVVSDINEIVELTNKENIIKFGKNKIIKIV